MNHKTERFPGHDQLELHYEEWMPDAPPRAVLAIVHGVGEHCGRYPAFVGGLVPQGIGVAGYDHRGHGRSGGKRGHIDSWLQYRRDLAAFIARVQRLYSAPFFLYGHSMGSLVVLDYLLADPANQKSLRGLILSGIALEPVGLASPALIAVSKVLSALTPGLYVPMASVSSRLSRDPQVGPAYDADPYVGKRFTARWGTESLNTVKKLKSAPAALNLPVMVLHGEQDQIVSLEGARTYFDRITSADKKMIVYPGGFHEPHNDLDNRQVAADIAAWIDAHVA